VGRSVSAQKKGSEDAYGIASSRHVASFPFLVRSDLVHCSIVAKGVPVVYPGMSTICMDTGERGKASRKRRGGQKAPDFHPSPCAPYLPASKGPSSPCPEAPRPATVASILPRWNRAQGNRAIPSPRASDKASKGPSGERSGQAPDSSPRLAKINLRPPPLDFPRESGLSRPLGIGSFHLRSGLAKPLAGGIEFRANDEHVFIANDFPKQKE